MNKILVVDDDEPSLRLMEKILTPAGYQVSKAPDGIQALNLLKRERFDLVITDVSMPRISGLRLLEEVKKHYRVPAIVVTASEIDSETQRKSYAFGARTFMLKPLEREEVLAAVADILKKKGCERNEPGKAFSAGG